PTAACVPHRRPGRRPDVAALLLAVAVVLLAVVVVLAPRLRALGAEAERGPDPVPRRGGASRGLATSEDVVRQLRAALDAVPQGVMVVDAAGAVVARNRAARDVAVARHGEALVSGAVDELTAAAITGTGGTRTIELYGPPARV